MKEIHRFVQGLNEWESRGVEHKDDLLNEIELLLKYVGTISSAKNVKKRLLKFKDLITETKDNEMYTALLNSYNAYIRQDVEKVCTIQINIFLEEMNTSKTNGVNYKDRLLYKLDLLVNDLNEVEGFQVMVGRLYQMKELICKMPNNEMYTKCLQTYHGFIESDNKEIEHDRHIQHLEQLVKQMEHQVLSLSIPVVRPSVFENLRENYKNLRIELSSHKDDCHAFAAIRQATDDVGVKIKYLVEDNKIFLSWMGVDTALTGASIGIAFIPVVGIPIAAGVAASSYIGKLIHRLVVSSKRKKSFNQN